MSNRGTVAWAVIFKIDSFPMIPEEKDGYQHGHDMLHGGQGKIRHKFNFLKLLQSSVEWYILFFIRHHPL